jgi:plastocyanin
MGCSPSAVGQAPSIHVAGPSPEGASSSANRIALPVTATPTNSGLSCGEWASPAPANGAPTPNVAPSAVSAAGTSTAVAGIGAWPTCFQPATATIRTGAIVQWQEATYDVVVVTLDDGVELGPIQHVLEVRFNRPGTYAYHGNPGSAAVGSVTVEGPALPGPALEIWVTGRDRTVADLPTGSPSVAAATPTPTPAPTPTPSPIATATAVAIDGGCGQTPLYAGPGPDAIQGLSANPWSVATPASAGIVAYFWGQAPYLAAGMRPHGENNKVLWLGGGFTSVVAHRLDDPKATARLELPIHAGPSFVDLPAPGCWRLELQTSGRTVASIDLPVAPAAAAVATPLATCPVTKPTPPFTAPSPAPASPPASYDEVWYGTRHLWTMLPPAGQVWTAGSLPHEGNGIFQKMFWWSADWKLESELMPAISVSGVRLDGGGGTFGVAGGTNAIADFGTAMLVGVEFPFAGCWQVTAKYRDASLTYVLWLKP